MTREDEQGTRVEYRGTGFYVGLASAILFALALFILAVQNTHDVEVEFLFFDFSLPLFAIAIGAALIAVILDELIGLVWRRRRRRTLEERAELERLRARTGVGEDEPETADIDWASGTPGAIIGDDDGDRAENRRHE